MVFRTLTTPICRIAGVALGAVVLAGCASADPSDDIHQAAEIVAARAGVSLDWECPWERDGPVWDRRSPLSAHTAVAAALQANRDLRHQIETIAAARADLAQAKLLPNPVLSVGYGIGIDGRSGDALVGALLMQLEALWTRSTRVAAEEAQLRAAVLTTSDGALRLVASVRSLHARLVHGERSLRQETEAADRARELEAIAEAAFAAGTTTIDARNRERDERIEAERHLAQRTARVETLQRQLLHAIGDAGADVPLTTDGRVELPGGGDEIDERAVLERAQSRRLDVAAALAAFDAESRGVVLARLSRIPTIHAGVGYERNLAGREGVFPRGQIEIPIFDTGAVAVASAESTERSAALDAERILQDALLDVGRAHVAVDEARTLRDRVARDALTFATDDAASAAAALESGVVARSAWVRAEVRRLHASVDLEDANAELAARLFDLERAVGGSLAP